MKGGGGSWGSGVTGHHYSILAFHSPTSAERQYVVAVVWSLELTLRSALLFFFMLKAETGWFGKRPIPAMIGRTRPEGSIR